MKFPVVIPVISAVLLGVCLWLGWQQLVSYQERPVITITAAYDVPDIALPVFAQFIVTQHVVIHEPVRVTALLVPLYAPVEGQYLQIDLFRNETLAGQWQYTVPVSQEVHLARLALEPPLLLDGELEIIFSGEHIEHGSQADAPRLFMEPSRAAYPEGYYRIAQNNKEGNISLQVIESNTGRELLAERFRALPIQESIQVVRWLLVLLILWALPYVLYAAGRGLVIFHQQPPLPSNGGSKNNTP
jgi:hypothetical protein